MPSQSCGDELAVDLGARADVLGEFGFETVDRPVGLGQVPGFVGALEGDRGGRPILGVGGSGGEAADEDKRRKREGGKTIGH